jgi:hypothetical protein
MIFMAFVALFFVKEGVVDNAIKYIVYLITFGSIVMIVFVTNSGLAKKFSFLLVLVKPLKEKFKKLYDVMHKYQYKKMLIAESLVISFISQLLFFASFGIAAASIGSRIPLKDLFVKMPIVSMMSLLPSINGLGVREGSTVALFGPIIGTSHAFALSVLWVLVLLCTSVMGGLVYALSPQFKIKLKKLEKDAQDA